MPNNATRRKAHAMSQVLRRKTHTAEEKRRQLREAGVIERYGPNAKVNAILAAENERGHQQEANYAAELAARKNNGSKHASKHANKPNNKPKNNSPMTWVTYKGKYQKMTLKKAKELGLK